MVSNHLYHVGILPADNAIVLSNAPEKSENFPFAQFSTGSVFDNRIQSLNRFVIFVHKFVKFV